MGYSYVYHKRWLKENTARQLVYLESNLGVLFHLLQTNIGRQMAEDKQVHFYFFLEQQDLEFLIAYLAAYFCNLKVTCSTSPSYRLAYPDLSQYIEREVVNKQELLTTRIMESHSSSSQAYLNCLKKFPNLAGNFNASKFRDLFLNVPCIICGAGPSLKKNLELLKDLKDRAIILAGSSAVPILNHAGLTPHFGNFFDPYYRVQERLLKTTDFELPTFHCARTYFETSRWIHGPGLYTKGSDEFPFIDWIENEQGFKGETVREYISVTAYNTSIALMMGCSPIIYVGVDLAYTDNKKYMSGLEKNIGCEEEKDEESEEFTFNEDVWATDIHGDPIKTRYGWQVESRFIGNILKDLGEGRLSINSTEGGLGLENTTNLSLTEVKERYLLHTYPIDDWVHSAIQDHEVKNPKSVAGGLKLFKEFRKSLSRLNKIYQGVIKQVKALQKENKKRELDQIDESYLVEAEYAISDEIAYQYLMTHYHQIIDAENLKTYDLYRLLSEDAPQILKNEIHLNRVLSRYATYLKTCKGFEHMTKKEINACMEDPWE